MKRKKLPRAIIGGEQYRPVVLIVRSKNADGSPAVLEHLREDDVADIARGDREFLVVYGTPALWGPSRAGS